MNCPNCKTPISDTFGSKHECGGFIKTALEERFDELKERVELLEKIMFNSLPTMREDN